MREYSENSFVKFSLKYPVKWNLVVTHSTNGIYLKNKNTVDQKDWFSVEKKRISVLDNYDRIAEARSNVSTTVWTKFQAKRYEQSVDEWPESRFVLEIYPKDYNKEAIVFSGDKDNFELFLNSITGFEIKK